MDENVEKQFDQKLHDWKNPFAPSETKAANSRSVLFIPLIKVKRFNWPI